MDVFLYSGQMRRLHDLKFIEFVNSHKRHENVVLVLSSLGGDPDAAYKIGRYLQKRYDNIQILVAGLCKSAGTLLAIAGNEIIFSPYGELGPLDIQLTKTDQIAGMESGLSIKQAFETLHVGAKQTFHDLVQEIISIYGGVISFQTASHSASEIVSSLYGPIFARIDPEEVGSRTRAMQIAADYGRRLNLKFNNLKPEALDVLAQTYPSHSFVIDLEEAENILNRVRAATEAEKKLVRKIGLKARFPGPELAIECLTDAYAAIDNEDPDDENPTENDDAGEHPTSGGSEDDEGYRDPASEGGVSSGDETASTMGEDDKPKLSKPKNGGGVSSGA